MVASCSASGCKSKTKKGGNISFHSFPSKNIILRQQWILAMNRENFEPSQHSRLCSLHFREEDFFRHFGKKTLKADVVPTIFPPPQNQGKKKASCTKNVSKPVNEQILDVSQLRNKPESATVNKEKLPQQTVPDHAYATNVESNQDCRLEAIYIPIYDECIVPENGYVTVEMEPTMALTLQTNSTHDEVMENISQVREHSGCDEFPTPGERISVNRELQNSATDKSVAETPYFKSIKSFLIEDNRLAEVCRICFRSLLDTEMTKLYEDSSSAVKEMVQIVLPQLDLKLYPNVVICTKCVQLIEHSHQLKQMCCSTEQKLLHLIKNNEKMTNKDADLIIVIQGGVKENPDMRSSVLNNFMSTNVKQSTKYVSVLCEGVNLNDSISICPPQLNRRKNKMKKGSKRSYLCSKCGTTFGSLFYFERHGCRNKENMDQMCEKCGEFVPSRKWTVHQRNHYRKEIAKPKHNKCITCNVQFSNSRQLSVHKYRFHENRRWQCHICGREYSSPFSLKAHMRYHNPKKKNKFCRICEKTFYTYEALTTHVARHFGKKLYKCGHCGKGVSSQRTLTNHVTFYHSAESRFVCEICGRRFVGKPSLQRHITLHFEEFSN